jgi:predicted O-methyltransferase YrrM
MSTMSNPLAAAPGEHRAAVLSRTEGNRYWWHHREECKYEPPIYSWLTDDEWELMRQWFVQSGEEFGEFTGECGIPPLSMLQGLIMGNGIRRVVQLGHYVGYSTILISLMMQRMNSGGQLFSIDIDQRATDFTQGWVDRFGTDDSVTLRVSDSADADAGAAAIDAFGGQAPQLVFIDSSHMYEHTLKELDLWYPLLQDWGFIVMHDASTFAADFDATSGGGVRRAIDEWNLMATDRIFTINSQFSTELNGEDLVYVDGCGLGMLQKVPR